MREGFVQRGGWWVVGQFALMTAVIVPGLLCRREPRLPVVTLTGIAFLAVSAGCGLAGAVTLRRQLTPFPKPSAGMRLVRGGIYGWMRHPLYTAVLCGSVGWALVRQSIPALAATLILAIYLDAKARHEERWLRARFPEYAEYERQARRFIPGIY